MSIGENLKRIRRDKNWTQGQLANNCGIRLGQISKVERGDTDPKLSTIYALMNALECTPNALLSDTEKTNLDGLLTIALERMQKLPERDKNILLEIIDKYCIAKSMQDIIENEDGKIFGFRHFAGRTQEMAKKDID
ncbi:Dna-binding helix-turn-helix protein [Vibrio tapetis subsp. tapetis]|uniref:Dna-binding helix-turn-helix protein n=1 Tax=Vibrio tapetis subsp. tapetis TaxID=1671868 RepID=A0A2N8ZLC9_9VIBR|nr:Dna-binding helix-turn-helix protein [Vibrio tapetis subsp. tapetis]